MRVAYARWAEGIVALTIAILFIASVIVINDDPIIAACERWSPVAWAAPLLIIIGGSILRYRVARRIGWLWLVEGIVALNIAGIYVATIQTNYSPLATFCERWSSAASVAAPVLLVIGGSILCYRAVRIFGWVWLMALWGRLLYFLM